jgi:hypothetical protein
MCDVSHKHKGHSTIFVCCVFVSNEMLKDMLNIALVALYAIFFAIKIFVTNCFLPSFLQWVAVLLFITKTGVSNTVFIKISYIKKSLPLLMKQQKKGKMREEPDVLFSFKHYFAVLNCFYNNNIFQRYRIYL